MNLRLYAKEEDQQKFYAHLIHTKSEGQNDIVDVSIYYNNVRNENILLKDFKKFGTDILHSFNETSEAHHGNHVKINSSIINNNGSGVLYSISKKSIYVSESVYKKQIKNSNKSEIDQRSFIYSYRYINLYNNSSPISNNISHDKSSIPSKYKIDNASLSDGSLKLKNDSHLKLKNVYGRLFFSNFRKLTRFKLPERVSTEIYFSPSSSCLISGTISSDKSDGMSCACKPQWHGRFCSFPSSVFFSNELENFEEIIPRNYSKRLINLIAFNVEFELLEARVHELNEIVDLFVIFESNYSNYGEAKPLRLHRKLQAGYLKEFHHKIFYLLRDFFPSGGKEDGWIVDHHMRNFIGEESIKRISNLQQDDMFIYTDADEIPSFNSLLFLKLHDGYPEPIGFTYRWSVFGFFWRQLEPTRLFAGCSLSMMKNIFEGNVAELRAGDIFSKFPEKVQAHIDGGQKVQEWYIGEQNMYAGWHCSWCLSPSRIRIKLVSAINADFPRWGNFPEKRDLNYIKNLIKTGTWFDNIKKLDQFVDRSTDNFYAPTYLMQNEKIYKHLLDINNI